MDIGEILSNARQSAGLTQEQVAEHLHVSRQTISNWENCKTYPDILMSIELSKLYGIDLTSLLEDTTGPSEYAKQLAKDSAAAKRFSNKRISTVLYIFALVILIAGIMFAWVGKPTFDSFSLYYEVWILPICLLIIAVFLGLVLDKKGWPIIPLSAVMGMLAFILTFGLKIYILHDSPFALPSRIWGMLQEALLYALPCLRTAVLGFLIGFFARRISSARKGSQDK